MSTSFDPKTALLAAGVIAVKMSHRQVQPSAVPEMKPEYFAKYLQALDLMPSTLHARMIDELDRAFEARNIEEGIEQLDLHGPKRFLGVWENVGPSVELKARGGTLWQGYKLASRVRGALPWYASLKDRDGDAGSTACLTDNQGLPLAFSDIFKSAKIPAFLAMTLSWHDWVPWLSGMQPTTAVPWPGSISLLHSLISTPGHGPDNYKFHGHTLWEYVVTLVHNLSDIYKDKHIFEQWLLVFEIMLDNDADPCASCIHNSQGFVDAVANFMGWEEVPSTVSSHTTPDRVTMAREDCEPLQWNPRSLVWYHHPVEAVVRDVFVRRQIPGSERLLNLLHEKKKTGENLNVRRQDDPDISGGGRYYPHWIS